MLDVVHARILQLRCRQRNGKPMSKDLALENATGKDSRCSREAGVTKIEYPQARISEG